MHFSKALYTCSAHLLESSSFIVIFLARIYIVYSLKINLMHISYVHVKKGIYT